MSTSNLAFAARPLAVRPQIATRSTSDSSPPSSCECSRTYNLTCEQGQTLSTKITLKLDGVAIDVTGGEFQFTSKTDASIPDSDPSVVELDWQETNTPTLGITWLKLPASVTQGMQAVPYQYQIRFVSSGGIVTPLVKGVLTVTTPVSSRFT